MTTVLLDNDFLYDRDRGRVLSLALAHFGEVAQTLANGKPLNPPEVLRDEPLLSWQEAIAEELLLLAQTDRAKATLWATKGFGSQKPFRHGPPLSALLPLGAAAAVIPLDTGRPSHPGAWLHLWLVRDPDNSLGNDDRVRLEGAGDWMRPCRQAGIKLFVVTAPDVQNEIPGPSWQLGACLARRALDDPPQVVELAERWLVTGAVNTGSSDQKTVPVFPGNKTTIAWRETRRSWLLPSLNANTPDGHAVDFGHNFILEAHGRLQVATTVEAAWRVVAGKGTVHSDDLLPWPQEPPVFHGMVADALGPLLGSILATQPKTLVLWCSKPERFS